MTDTPETGRPVPRAAELFEGVTCALSISSHLGYEECRHIARFQRFLADQSAVMARYAPRLDAITARHSLDPLRPYPDPDRAGGDPESVRLWDERAAWLRALIREYDADTREGETG